MTKAEETKRDRVEARLRKEYPAERGYDITVYTTPGMIGMYVSRDGLGAKAKVPDRYNVFAIVKILVDVVEKLDQLIEAIREEAEKCDF